MENPQRKQDAPKTHNRYERPQTCRDAPGICTHRHCRTCRFMYHRHNVLGPSHPLLRNQETSTTQCRPKCIRFACEKPKSVHTLPENKRKSVTIKQQCTTLNDQGAQISTRVSCEVAQGRKQNNGTGTCGLLYLP